MEPINYKRLKRLGACESGLEVILETFGEEDVPLNIESALKVAYKIDWGWAAQNLLSDQGYVVYEEAIEPLLKAYQESITPIWKAYKESITPLRKDYKEAKAPIWEAYVESITPLWEAYEEAKAKLFAELYLEEQQN